MTATPKETKAERFARLEAHRLATRPTGAGCARCRLTLTQRRSGLCRRCERR